MTNPLAADTPTAGSKGRRPPAVPLAMLAPKGDGRLMTVIVVMGIVTAGYPSYVAHPVTLLAPVPLLAALLLLDDARLTSPVWIALVAAMMTWTVLLYLAMAGTGTSLIHSLSMYAPFAALAFRTRRPEPVVLVYAILTTTLVTVRVVVSFVSSGAKWLPWQVYEGNDLAPRLNMLLPLVLVAWMTVSSEQRRARTLLIALFVAGVASVVVVQSRSGLGLLLVLAAIGLARTNWKWLIAFGVVALAAWFALSASILSLLERARFIHFVPVSPRQEIWRVAFEAMRGSSWLGVGPGNSDDALREVGGGHAHNSLVQTALEAGWPGALLFAGFTLYLIVLAARLLWRGGQDTLWALSLLAYLGGSVVSAPIVRPDFTLALVLVIMGAREHVYPRGGPWAPQPHGSSGP